MSVASPAQSGHQSVLYSPMLTIETSNSQNMTIDCSVLNASSSARDGTIQILQGDGTPLSTVSYNNLPPGVVTGTAVKAFQNTAQVTLVYCKITVDDKPDAIRGSLILYDSLGNTWATVEAH